MLHTALFLLFVAQILHFTRHWIALSRDLYADYSDRRLKAHLNWSRSDDMPIIGDTRPGSAMRRAG